jgi:phosphoglycerol transferase MdoB-like AlkP superfamily enzyme
MGVFLDQLLSHFRQLSDLAGFERNSLFMIQGDHGQARIQGRGHRR